MRIMLAVAVAAFLTACGGSAQNTLPTAGQPSTGGGTVRVLNEYPAYSAVALPSLGGTVGAGNSINNRGWVTGVATLSGSSGVHASLWRHGAVTDLGTLGGTNSGVEWQVNNDRGIIAGISETSTTDPLNESWSCEAFFPADGHTCVGFVWKDNVITALSTLGGNNGYAAGVNERGDIVGWAETTYHDPTCVAPTHVLQFLPVVWKHPGYTIEQLKPFGSDPDGAATAINDSGQVVGISGICDQQVGRLSARHALLWERGVPHDLGNLGGKAWNTPTAINQAGAVVGFSDLHGDRDGNRPNFHAFYWTRATGMADIGVLPGDSTSEALGINDHGVVVGVSYSRGFTRSRAFIWRFGKRLVNLQTLLPKSTGLSLLFANSINDSGAISGEACVVSSSGCSSVPAFVAMPMR